MRMPRDCAGLFALFALVACGPDSPTAPDGAAFAVVADDQAQGGRLFTTTLSGAAEVPGPGDTDGSGTAQITINPGTGLVCWELTAQDIAPAAAAHIHVGDASVAGPVVVTLSPPTTGRSTGCTTADRELATAIRKNPSNYYVNVHNADFPAGALRGQL